MKQIIRFSGLALASLAMTVPVHGQEVDLDNENDQVSYSVGVNIGRNLADQNLADQIDIDAFVQGMRDVLADDVQLSQQQMRDALSQLQQRLVQQQQQTAQENLEEGESFLDENAQREEVQTTDSGLQYQVLERGDGSGQSPSGDDTVLAHYEGRLIDGEVFDSSRERGEPAEFQLNQVIQGWTEGLQMMQPGDRYRLFIPAELGYGESGSGPIPPNSTLIFDVELLDVNPGSSGSQSGSQ